MILKMMWERTENLLVKQNTIHTLFEEIRRSIDHVEYLTVKISGHVISPVVFGIIGCLTTTFLSCLHFVELFTFFFQIFTDIPEQL